MAEKIQNDENDINEQVSLIRNLKTENDKATRIIQELERQSDLNRMELEKINDEI